MEAAVQYKTFFNILMDHMVSHPPPEDSHAKQELDFKVSVVNALFAVIQILITK
jgi:hypothetical protein